MLAAFNILGLLGTLVWQEKQQIASPVSPLSADVEPAPLWPAGTEDWLYYAVLKGV